MMIAKFSKYLKSLSKPTFHYINKNQQLRYFNSGIKDMEDTVQYLKVSNAKNPSEDRQIAYLKSEGIGKLGVVYIPGFHSFKDSDKPTLLHQYCKDNHISYIRYDPTTLGDCKTSIKPDEVRFSHWIKDAEEVLNKLTDGPQLVIGSSMGAWIASIVGSRYPEKCASLLLLAPGINFAREFYKQMEATLPKSVIQRLEDGGTVEIGHPSYTSKIPISLDMINDFIKHELNLEDSCININCPIRIIHGTNDIDVDYRKSYDLVNAFSSTDLQLHILKGKEHHLTEDDSLELIKRSIIDMISKYEKN